MRCTRSRGPRGFFCLQDIRRGPVNVDVMSLNRMQFIGNLLAVLFGLACIAGTIYHEVKWRFMIRNWQETTGRITGEIDGDETSSPEIEYEHDGKPIRFVSRYGGGSVKTGESVVVLFDPATGEAEELKWSNRWLPTIAMLSFGMVGVYIGLFAG